MGDGSSMVARSGMALSDVPSVLPVQHDTRRLGKSAGYCVFPKTKLPPLEDYRRACADLIWATFKGKSENAVCDNAAETGLASADTFHRILRDKTRKPDGHLMHCVILIALDRGVSVPTALMIRIEAAE